LPPIRLFGKGYNVASTLLVTASMKHTIKHPLSRDLAKRATEKAFEAYGERFSKYNPTATWSGDYSAQVGFEAKGVKLGGTIDIREGGIDLEMNVPFVFKPFRKKAVDIIESEIRNWIKKAEDGELD
jgi:hypothetical protein